MSQKTIAVIRLVKVLKWQHGETGENARRERREKRLSLREVARRMGISAPYLCDLELGRRAWNVERCRKFEAAINGGSR